MQKVKTNKLQGLVTIIKCGLIGIVATLIGTVIFAVVLKFANLSSTIIGYINNVIKIFSIFIMMLCVKRNNPDKLLLKALFAGAVYALLGFIVFSILNGSFNFNLSFVYDLLFAIIVAAIQSVIINIINIKKL